MAGLEGDNVHVLPDRHPQLPDEQADSRFGVPARRYRKRSASMPVKMNSTHCYGQMNGQRTQNAVLEIECHSSVEGRDQNNGFDDIHAQANSTIRNKNAKSWARRCFSFLHSTVLGVVSPHASAVKKWNKFYVFFGSLPMFIDPLFFFLLSVHKEHYCIVIDWPVAYSILLLRSIIDFIYLFHMLLQFRLAYVDPKSTTEELVKDPKKIALHYLTGKFLADLFLVLPVPQVMILVVLPKFSSAYDQDISIHLITLITLIQCFPRLVCFASWLTGQSQSIWEILGLHLLVFAVVSHVVGSYWYLFGLQRVSECLDAACGDAEFNLCKTYVYCAYGHSHTETEVSSLEHDRWNTYIANANTSCFSKDQYHFGIFGEAASLIGHNFGTRYLYSLFWGFQQISTLAGNQIPKPFVGEIVFTMFIIGTGLVTISFLFGNMQNCLHALERRRFENSLRRHDVEQWMSNRNLPTELKRQIREAEKYNWTRTKGLNEEKLLKSLPENLQRDVRRHLFKFINDVPIFTAMSDSIIDSICELVKQETYIKGSKILDRGSFVEKMVFIVRGTMESIKEDGNKVTLCEGDICGEELLAWCLEHYSGNRDARTLRILGQEVISNRMVKCLSNVEVCTLQAADVVELVIDSTLSAETVCINRLTGEALQQNTFN